jgi:flagellar biogenesis protein FliO
MGSRNVRLSGFLILSFALFSVLAYSQAADPAAVPAAAPGSQQVAQAASPASATPPALVAPPASAIPPTTTAPAEASGIPDYPVFRTLGGLGVVISMIVLGFFAARKYAPQFFNRTPCEQRLKILESLSMGDKRSIALVQVEGACYLVGNTGHQINLLAQLPQDFPQSRPGYGLDSGDSFRKLYEVEKKPGKGVPKAIPPDVRAKMRQLREALEQ